LRARLPGIAATVNQVDRHVYTLPLVSVLMPAYNQAPFVRQAIESALAQTVRELEVIVVDDGSTDETAALAAEFRDQITYIRQQNAGPSAARNTALAAARGSLIQLLDADDELYPDYLERMIECVEREPEASVFTASWDEIDASGAVTGRIEAAPWPQDTFHALFDPMLVGPPSRYLVRRAAIDKAGFFDPAMRACEDWDVWVRMAAAGCRFVAVPEARVRYRSHPGSRSKRYPMMWASGKRELENAAGMHRNCPICWRARARGLARWREWCYVSMLAPQLRSLFDQDNYLGATRHALSALATDPKLVLFLLRSARTRGYAIRRAADP
jgi:glycosyltransferase involved in cell wall biosynthesis